MFISVNNVIILKVLYQLIVWEYYRIKVNVRRAGDVITEWTLIDLIHLTHMLFIVMNTGQTQPRDVTTWI